MITTVEDLLVLVFAISLLAGTRWALTGAVIAGVVKLATTVLGFIIGSAESRISVSLYELLVVSALSLVFIAFSIKTRRSLKVPSVPTEPSTEERKVREEVTHPAILVGE